MITGRVIHDPSAAPAILQVALKQPVVEAILPFVNQHPCHRGRWPDYLRVFAKDDVIGLADVHVEEVVHPAIHGHASDTWQPLRAKRRYAAVGRAAIHGRRPHVGTDLRVAHIGQVERVGVVRIAVIEVEPARNPGVGVRVAASAHTGQAISIVLDVHEPGHLELPQVVHAADASRLQLRPVQRGQKQRRQNGNDRDHHQQFNKSEPGRFPEAHAASASAVEAAAVSGHRHGGRLGPSAVGRQAPPRAEGNTVRTAHANNAAKPAQMLVCLATLRPHLPDACMCSGCERAYPHLALHATPLTAAQSRQCFTDSGNLRPPQPCPVRGFQRQLFLSDAT